MYKGHWIHSLLYFEFVELTLNIVLFCHHKHILEVKNNLIILLKKVYSQNDIIGLVMRIHIWDIHILHIHIYTTNFKLH